MSPGQHLHAIWVAQFRGAGWEVRAPGWDDFDAAGQAKWEELAALIGSDVRVARAGRVLLRALKAVLDRPHFDRERDDETIEAVTAAEAAIYLAERS